MHFVMCMSMWTVAIADTTFGLAHKRGLAVLVTCDYEDTNLRKLDACNTDADEMKAALEAQDYEVHQLKNKEATKENVDLLLDHISKYLCRYEGSDVKDGQKKAIVFAFSGHGTTGDCIVTHDDQMLQVQRDIVNPLLESGRKNSTVCKIPKLFFLDADRGMRSGDEHLLANYRIDYATSPDHVTYINSDWMQKLARKLKDDDDSLQNLVSKVNEEVYDQAAPDRKQQCWTCDCLNTGPLYLGKVTTRCYNTHPQYVKVSVCFFTYHPCSYHFIVV